MKTAVFIVLSVFFTTLQAGWYSGVRSGGADSTCSYPGQFCKIEDDSASVVIGYQGVGSRRVNAVFSPEIAFSDSSQYINLLAGRNYGKVNVKLGASYSWIEGFAINDSIEQVGLSFITTKTRREFDSSDITLMVQIEYGSFFLSHRAGNGKASVDNQFVDSISLDTPPFTTTNFIRSVTEQLRYDIEQTEIGLKFEF